MADGNKKTVDGDIAACAVFISDRYAAKLIFTVQSRYRAFQHEFNIILAAERLHELRLTAEGRPAVDEIYLRAGIAQKHRVLQRGVAAAADRDRPVFIKRAVAYRAEANTVSDKLLLPLKPKHSGLRADGDNEGLCLELAAEVRFYALYIAVKLRGYDLVELKLRALGLGLSHEPVAELSSGDGRYRGVIFNLGRPCDLPAEGAFFYHKDGFSRPQGVEGGGESRRSSAYYYYIVHISYLNRYCFIAPAPAYFSTVSPSVMTSVGACFTPSDIASSTFSSAMTFSYSRPAFSR